MIKLHVFLISFCMKVQSHKKQNSTKNINVEWHQLESSAWIVYALDCLRLLMTSTFFISLLTAITLCKSVVIFDQRCLPGTSQLCSISFIACDYAHHFLDALFKFQLFSIKRVWWTKPWIFLIVPEYFTGISVILV